MEVPVPPARVWPLLTTPEGLAGWYAFDGVVVEPEPGGRLVFTWAEHGTYRGRVTIVDEPATFAFRLAVSPDGEPVEGHSTLVTLTVTAAGPGSVVALRQTGFADLDPGLGDSADLAAAEIPGWERGLRRLADAARARARVGADVG